MTSQVKTNQVTTEILNGQEGAMTGRGITNATFEFDDVNFILTLRAVDPNYPITCTVHYIDATSTFRYKNISFAGPLTVQMPSTTVTGAVAGITTALMGADPYINWFAYLVVENNSQVLTPYLAISRSPFLSQMPGVYYYALTASTRTLSGASSPNYIPFLGKGSALTGANHTLVCLGCPVTIALDRDNGRVIEGEYRGGLSSVPTAYYETGKADQQGYTPVFTGFSADPTIDSVEYFFNVKERLCNVIYTADEQGTSNSTAFTMTPPYLGDRPIVPIAMATNNSSPTSGASYCGFDGVVYLNGAAAGWTNSGTKGIGNSAETNAKRTLFSYICQI